MSHSQLSNVVIDVGVYAVYVMTIVHYRLGINYSNELAHSNTASKMIVMMMRQTQCNHIHTTNYYYTNHALELSGGLW